MPVIHNVNVLWYLQFAMSVCPMGGAMTPTGRISHNALGSGFPKIGWITRIIVMNDLKRSSWRFSESDGSFCFEKYANISFFEITLITEILKYFYTPFYTILWSSVPQSLRHAIITINSNLVLRMNASSGPTEQMVQQLLLLVPVLARYHIHNITANHGRRSMWDKGTRPPPQYLDWGTLSRMSPSIFLE